jgi:hypothetical protein
MADPTLTELFDEIVIQHMDRQTARGHEMDAIALDTIQASIRILRGSTQMMGTTLGMNDREWLDYRIKVCSAVIDVLLSNHISMN